MRYLILRGRHVIAAAALIVVVILAGGCKGTLARNVVPYIPPTYYNCSETTINNLWAAYWGHANPLPDAETVFKGQAFVFKDIIIDDSMLASATENYIWVNEIQCYFLQGGSANRLKAGEKFDIVGVNERVSTEYSERLVFTGCIFLPAGSAQLPIVDTSGLALPTY